ncbi:MAG TPA: SIMPL domain-containing protein [Streptosporangiaceae bacterium]|nr:SIMPL domain-containing protein [Streptosporangiaceae bacterium]
MDDVHSVLLSVRAEARQLVAPDFVVLDAMIEHTAGSKQEAVRSAAASLGHLTTDLAALGGVPFTEGAGRRPMTWSAHSSATREEQYHDQQTGRVVRSGQVTATVAVRVTIRDLGMLEAAGEVLAAHPSLNLHAVAWQVDWDNPVWPQVRAAAIQAAIGKARDYAAALGATVERVEHVADAGLLGDEATAYRSSAARALSAGAEGSLALDPVPQQLIATIDARVRATGMSLTTVQSPPATVRQRDAQRDA